MTLFVINQATNLTACHLRIGYGILPGPLRHSSAALRSRTFWISIVFCNLIPHICTKTLSEYSSIYRGSPIKYRVSMPYSARNFYVDQRVARMDHAHISAGAEPTSARLKDIGSQNW